MSDASPAPATATAGLLAEIDPLDYPARMRLLAGRARVLAGSPELAGLVGELQRSERFERGIALYLAIVADYEPGVTAALGDPDWTLRRSALSAWLRSGRASAAEVTAFVADASWHARRQVYRVLRRMPRSGIADALIEAVWERFGDAEAARLLAACSTGTVSRLLPELGHAIADWSRLGGRHPEAVLSVAAQQLPGLPPFARARWWLEFGTGVLSAAPAAPDRVLDLLERYGPAGFLAGSLSRYSCLAAADGTRLAALLTAPGRAHWLERAGLPTSLLRALGRLDTAALAPVARRLRSRDYALAALLDAVPPSRRAALYDAAMADRDTSQDRTPDEILAVLPRSRRQAEARRILALSAVAADPELALHYTAFLPWAEAAGPLAQAAQRPLAADRATAYGLMLRCAAAAADPAAVTQVIEGLRRLRNEQEPVRTPVLTALARIPPRLIEPAAAPALKQLSVDAQCAPDASRWTLSALEQLAVSVLRAHFDVPELANWSLDTMQLLFETRAPALGRLDTRLRRGQETELFAVVRGWLEAGLQRGSCDALFAVAQALGRRAWRLRDLQDMLRQSIMSGQVSGVMRQGIALWLGDPVARHHRVAEVLRADSSAVTLPSVWAVLCASRTDLLGVVLDGPPPAGRFIAAGVRWVPTTAQRVDRWLPRQQAAFAALLARLAADAGARIPERAGAIRTAAAIPGAGWDVVQRWLGSPQVSLAEAALGGLARAGRPGDALAVLLAQADGDRARVAVYAAGRAARFLPPSELAAALAGDFGVGKVTSRKERLRLAATLSVPGAGDLLGQAWAQDGQHRDVRASAVSAARRLLHDPRAWPILDEAATGRPAEILALVAGTSPLRCPPRYRSRYGDLVLRASASADEEASRAALRALESWAHWVPGAAAAGIARVTDLRDRVLWKAAASLLAALLADGQAGAVLPGVTARLAELDRDPGASGTAGDPGRDRPARRRLDHIVRQAGQVDWAGLDSVPLADAGRSLAEQPDLALPAARLLLAAVPLGGDPRQLAAALTQVCDLLDDQPVTAGRVAAELAGRLGRAAHTDPAAVLAAAALLERDSRLAAGLLAVALARHGHGLGWPAPWRAQVERLRAHRLADVRAAAIEIALAQE